MGQLSIHMVDIGEQQSGHKKWIHNFKSVIFCTHHRSMVKSFLRRTRCVNGFEITISPTDGLRNQMKESLILFKSVIKLRWFLCTSIILFLNRTDVLKNKLPAGKVCLPLTFPRFSLL